MVASRMRRRGHRCTAQRIVITDEGFAGADF